jgi:hypothetical protein
MRFKTFINQRISTTNRGANSKEKIDKLNKQVTVFAPMRTTSKEIKVLAPCLKSKAISNKRPKGVNKALILDETASEKLTSADAVKAGARRASHVKPAWSGSCAVSFPRSVIPSHTKKARSYERA